MLQNYLADVKNWALRPYDENMDIYHWFLFIGLMAATTYLWSRVIRIIIDA